MAAGTYQAIVPNSPNIFSRGTVGLPEKASQTFKKGAPLVLNGGYLEEAGTAPSTIRYFAAENAHNGASDGLYDVIAWPIGADDLWEVSAQDAVAVADNGGVYGLVKDATTGFWYLDDDDTGDQMEVLHFKSTPALGAVGDTKARAIAKVQSGNIASA